MNVLILDESRKRRANIADRLSQKNHSVSVSSISGEFLELMNQGAYDMVILDVESWQRGKSIYNYFGIGKRLSETPVIFLNAPDNFVSVSERPRNSGDRVFQRPFDLDAVVDSVG
jgi:DNA-binding response OmpR family regulator